MHNTLKIIHERYPIAGKFTISRGSKTEAAVVVCVIGDGIHEGRGECVPYARYGETIESVSGQIEAVRTAIEKGALRHELQKLMRRALRAMPWIARCGIWKPNNPAKGLPICWAAVPPLLKPQSLFRLERLRKWRNQLRRLRIIRL